MKQADRIAAFARLGQRLETAADPKREAEFKQAFLRNNWFTADFTRQALEAIVRQFLRADRLESWLARYALPEETPSPRTVGTVMAGNIPLVGFHDLLCVLMAGHRIQVKQSSKDQHLLPWLAKQLIAIEPAFEDRIHFTDRLRNFDAVIATGSDNTSRYFEYYFGKYPHIIRKNRNAVAVLTGDETDAELQKLGDDVFLYFGLGCRNVSKIYLPEHYPVANLPERWSKYEWVKEHSKYRNNYDYNRTLLILNNIPHEANEFVMLHENSQIPSRIASVHYEFYRSKAALSEKLRTTTGQIQCIVASDGLAQNTVLFGASQSPRLDDYADDVDTMAFLVGLK